MEILELFHSNIKKLLELKQDFSVWQQYKLKVYKYKRQKNYQILGLWELTEKRFSSVQFSRSVVSNSLWPHESQHARTPCPSPTPGVYSNSCPSSRWCHPAISSSVVPSSSCPQSLPASGSFLSQLFPWGGQSIGVSASASVLPMNTQGWSLLGWTGWISLRSKGLSRVFSNTTVQKHQFFALRFLHSPTFTSIHDHWQNHSLDQTDLRSIFLTLRVALMNNRHQCQQKHFETKYQAG